MLVSALFVSLLAFVPASEARGRPRPRPRPAAPNGGLKTKVTTKRASAKCIAVATTYNFSKSLDAHAAAGARPFHDPPAPHRPAAAADPQYRVRVQSPRRGPTRATTRPATPTTGRTCMKS